VLWPSSEFHDDEGWRGRAEAALRVDSDAQHSRQPRSRRQRQKDNEARPGECRSGLSRHGMKRAARESVAKVVEVRTGIDARLPVGLLLPLAAGQRLSYSTTRYVLQLCLPHGKVLSTRHSGLSKCGVCCTSYSCLPYGAEGQGRRAAHQHASSKSGGSTQCRYAQHRGVRDASPIGGDRKILCTCNQLASP